MVYYSIPFNNTAVNKKDFEKLAYFEAHEQVATNEHFNRKLIDDEFDAIRRSRAEEFRIRREMSSLSVGFMQDRSIWYSISANNEKTLMKELFPNTVNFKSTLYYAKRTSVERLKIEFDHGSLHHQGTVDPERKVLHKGLEHFFRKKIGALAVSQRNVSDAMCQVFGLLYGCAERVELPLEHGWILEDEGKFRFIGEEEMTMGEVTCDV